MRRASSRRWMAGLAIVLAIVACNMPAATPQAQAPAEANTLAAPAVVEAAVSDVPSATSTSVPPTVAPTATQCVPMATANTNVNVRTGPDTAYDVIGFLPTGGTAPIAGQNDNHTWWYIAFAAGAGGHAWIAGSVITASCVPAGLAVVIPPPLPTAVPGTPTLIPSANAKPDLIISEFSISPSTPVVGENTHVRIGTYNQGDAPSGSYVVLWYGLSTIASPSCSWNVPHTNAHGGRILECDFVFASWYPINKTSLAIVDANNDVDESQEGNNQDGISPFGVTH